LNGRLAPKIEYEPNVLGRANITLIFEKSHAESGPLFGFFRTGGANSVCNTFEMSRIGPGAHSNATQKLCAQDEYAKAS
jgi:hypothetical protein